MNFAGNFLLKVAESPGCVRGLVRLHLSYCTRRTMSWLKELNFHFNQYCRGVATKTDQGHAEPNGLDMFHILAKPIELGAPHS